MHLKPKAPQISGKTYLSSLALVFLLTLTTMNAVMVNAPQPQAPSPPQTYSSNAHNTLAPDEFFELRIDRPKENVHLWDFFNMLNGNWKLLGEWDGQYHYKQVIHNLWTNVGLNRTGWILFNASLEAPANTQVARYISVHTSLAAGTCAYTSTSLANEQTTNGFSRVAASTGTISATGGVLWVNFTTTYTVTGAVNNINATGLWTNTSGGDSEILFACGQYANTNVLGGDTFTQKHASQISS